MNYFNSAGSRERFFLRKLSERLQMDVFLPMPDRCRYDAIGSKGNVISIFESKVRQFRHDKWDTTLIEKGKYQDLYNRYNNDECHKPLYVEFYTDRHCRIYNLLKIEEPTWVKQALNKTTMGNNDLVDKRVGYIDYSEGLLVDLGELYEVI